MSDHLQGARYQTSARREEVQQHQLQQRGPRSDIDTTVGVQMAEAVAGYPVQAEDQVIPAIHVHQGHGNRLAGLVAQAQKGLQRVPRDPAFPQWPPSLQTSVLADPRGGDRAPQLGGHR